MRHLRRLTLPAGLVLALASTHASAAANVIVGHFAPFDDELAATAVDVRVNGTVALTGVRYGSFTEYLPLAPGQQQAVTARYKLSAPKDVTVIGWP